LNLYESQLKPIEEATIQEIQQVSEKDGSD
jgi:hypothetical protein